MTKFIKIVVAFLFALIGGVFGFALAGHQYSHPPKVTAVAEHKATVIESIQATRWPLPDPSTCLHIVAIVEGTQWGVRIGNTCDKPTKRTYIRLAFYDANGYRHGFDSFILEPLQPGERSRVDSKVPREGAASVKVFQTTTDPSIALGW